MLVYGPARGLVITGWSGLPEISEQMMKCYSGDTHTTPVIRTESVLVPRLFLATQE